MPRHIQPLTEYCIKLLCSNIESLYDIGNVEYRLISRVLRKCSPSQLLLLESKSPHILNDTNEIWWYLTIRDFRAELPLNQQEYIENKEGKLREFSSTCSWRDIYSNMEKQRLKRLNDASEKLRKSYQQCDSIKSKRALIFTDKIQPEKKSLIKKDNNRIKGIGIGIMDKARKETKAILGIYKRSSPLKEIISERKKIIAPGRKSGISKEDSMEMKSKKRKLFIENRDSEKDRKEKEKEMKVNLKEKKMENKNSIIRTSRSNRRIINIDDELNGNGDFVSYLKKIKES